jgi:hypothetical protein
VALNRFRFYLIRQGGLQESCFMLSHSLLNSLLIDLESSRHQLLKLVNPSLVSRMSRHKFRRFGTLTCRHHPFPESH